MSAAPNMTDSPAWYRFNLPFLFVGYFECEHCHRPIMKFCQFQNENDWQEHLFDVRCACNWGHTNYLGSKTTHQFVVEWKPEVRSLAEPK